MTAVNSSSDYSTPHDLRRALTAQLARRSRETGQTVAALQREFVFQRFLAVLFCSPDSPWVLKGGTGLRLRVPAARHSMDIDLLHLGASRGDDAVEVLRESSRRHQADQIAFEVGGVTHRSGTNPVTSVTVTCRIGASRYLSFSVDLAYDLSMVAPVEHVLPTPTVEIRGLPAPPRVMVYPMPDQVADKLCALYETTASGPSSRYRDLVDLVLVTSHTPLDAQPLAAAVAAEAARRHLTLKVPLQNPGPGWHTGYAREAARWAVPAELRDLDTALTHVGELVVPVLIGTVTEGRWLPGKGWHGETKNPATTPDSP